jgi:fructokinase
MANDLVVCLGELLLDMFPAEMGRSLVQVSAWHPKPGGAPANVAVAVARLGHRAAFIGKLGNDLFGHFLAGVLAENGVDVRSVRYDAEARTALAFHAKPDPDTAEFLFYRNPGADMRLEAADLDLALLEKTGAYHFGTISLIQEPSRTATLAALDAARPAGALISCDVNYRPSLWPGPGAARATVMAILPHVQLVKVNELELELLTGCVDPAEGSAVLLACGPELVVVTLGPQGSYFRNRLGSALVPGFSVPAIDAVGCGDAFVAALLCGLLAAGASLGDLPPTDLRGILRYANAVGALTSTAEGVIPALPTAARVAEFLHNREE